MASEFFLKFDKTIEGESIIPGFEKAIAIESWNWGASQTSTVHGTGGSGTGKASFSDVNVSFVFDKSVTEMMKSLTTGTHNTKAVLSAVKSGAKNKPYLELTMHEVFVTSINMSGAGEVPAVAATFTFKSFSMDYKIQDKDGVLATGGTAEWDLTKNAEK